MTNNNDINPASSAGYTTGKAGQPWLRDYKHATQLYRADNYALAPKTGFLYFVDFNINPYVQLGVKDKTGIIKNWDASIVGLLAKNVQLPKFKITTETINQYNRKTNIQTKINYEPVKLEFHDDNASNTNGLWKNYFKYYYTDPNYATDRTQAVATQMGDTKFNIIDYQYGYQNIKQAPFFDSIDIYVMHQRNYTKMSLINPLITSWEHDTLDQTEGNKMLKNSMTLVYEDVFYEQGSITDNNMSASFRTNDHWDSTPSTLSYGNQTRSNLIESNFRPPLDKVKPPSTGELSKSVLALGKTLRAANIARQVLENPKLAWQVYGFNPKFVLTNVLTDAVFASAARVTTAPVVNQGRGI